MLAHKAIFLCYGFLFFCCVEAQRIFGCNGVCETKVCRDVGSCENGTIMKSADHCGCCDICVDWLKEGDKCETQVVAPVPKQACGPRLTCDKQEKKCVPVKTQCMIDMAKYNDNSLFLQDISYRTSKPECDEFGHYKSMVCLPDILCYCVNNDGKRIFGTEIASRVNTSSLETFCKCSRAYDEFPKSVPNGDFLRCLANGDYDQLQCTDEWCYCMEHDDPDVSESIKFNASLKGLSCYDESLHKDFDATFRSQCWNKRNDLKQMIKKYADQNITIIGVDLPECDLDGSYSPVQCRGENCFCVDKDGETYGDRYKIPRYSKEAEGMNCHCARDKFLIRQEKIKTESMTFFDIEKCDENGNYKPKESD